MMRQFKIWFLLLISVACTTQQINNDQTTDQDTIFISQHVTEHAAHKVYILSSTPSETYNKLADFSFKEYDSIAYEQLRQYVVKDKPAAFQQHHDLLGLPTKWLPLYPYKQQLYLYSPCDWGYLNRRLLNDSALVSYISDGPSPAPIDRIQKVDQKTYHIDLKNDIGGAFKALHIHVLDSNTFLSLWEYQNSDNQSYFQVYIPKEHAQHYPILVNECIGDLEDEFMFDNIDYDSLKKQY